MYLYSKRTPQPSTIWKTKNTTTNNPQNTSNTKHSLIQFSFFGTAQTRHHNIFFLDEIEKLDREDTAEGRKS
jgi:hypothetical protein